MGLIAEKAKPMIKRLSRGDRDILAMAVEIEVEGGDHNPVKVTASDLTNVGFQCRQMILETAGRTVFGVALGVITAVTASLPGDPLVVLYAKEGKNLSLKDTALIKEFYADELNRRK